MKLYTVTLALLAAVLLPVFAYSSNNTDMDTVNAGLRKEPDPILASFERAFYREPIAYQGALVKGEADQLDVLNVALRGNETDPVSASFWRDLNRGLTACGYLSSAQTVKTLAC